MNVNSYLSPRLMVGAAIVGLVGAAGVFIYEQVYAEKRRAMLVGEVARLDRQVAAIRSEIETLRELQKETNLRRARPKLRVKREVAPAAGDVTDSEYFTDCQSLVGTDIDMDSEEFYDVPSDDDTLRDTTRALHADNDTDTDTVLRCDDDNSLILDEKKSNSST